MTARPRRRPRFLAGALVLALIAGACSGDDDGDETDPPSTTPSSNAATSPEIVSTTPDPEQAAAQVGLRLSEGAAIERPAEAVPVVAGEPLAPDVVAAILARLPEWDVPADDRRTFQRPAVTLPPPLIGATVETAFPPDAGPSEPPTPTDGPLRVVRYQPEGDVDIAPFVTVTFDRPMVPVATLDQLAAADVPVEITPAVDGRWRWIGTRTLRFEADSGPVDRLPAATEFRVEVARGTEAADGSRLDADVAWTFRTPSPRVVSSVGTSDSMPLAPVLVAVFDQRVDPAAVLPTITMRAGSDEVALRLATPDEIEADDDAARAVGDALADRAVAFRPVAPLPADRSVTVTVGPGTPSLEGPLPSTSPEVVRGRTYGEFDIARTDCGGGRCAPGFPLTIEMTNEIDVAAFSPDQVTISPAVPGLRVDVFGTTMQLTGATRGRTDYTVTLAAELTDTFGQQLGVPRSVGFEVGPAQPAIDGLPLDWITTDPFADTPTVPIRTINHDSVRVLAWAVSPTDVPAFREYLEASWSDTRPAAPDWPLVLDEVIDIEAEADRFVETAIDLSAAFAAGSQLVVRVEPVESYSQDDELYWQNRPTTAWVQATTLAVAAVHDRGEMLIWTTDMRTGEPVGNVAVELLGDGRVARTDADGLARLPLADLEVTGVFANAGDRTAFLPFDWYGGVRASPAGAEGRWYVFDDRGIYRPGETARITGWVRRLAWADDAGLGLYEAGLEVQYAAYDAQGAELASGTAPINDLGGFDITLPIPEGANLGAAWVDLALLGLPGDEYASSGHAFQVQEFRRPEFEVTARQESSGPYYVSEPATLAVDATYFAGGPLGDAEVAWLVSTQQTTYRPPNRDDFQFGVWQPWWFGDDSFARDTVASGFPCPGCPPGGETAYAEFAGRTDAAGTHYLDVELGAGGADVAPIDLPRSITAEATVVDVNRQAWASRTDLLVHPSRVYVGLRTDRTFVEAGTPLRYDLVVTDVDGAAVPGRTVEVTAGRVEWQVQGGEWTEAIVDPTVCTITSTADPADGSMRCEFATGIAGEYRVTAVVTDDAGRPNRTETTTWVAGDGSGPVRRLEQQRVTIVPDRETYAVGDTAELLVQVPFDATSGLATVSHADIVSSEAFAIEGGSAVIEVPIDEASVPGLTVQVDVIGTATRTADDGTPLPDAPPRPAFATGQIALDVPPLTRALTVTASPAAAQLDPGTDTSVTVTVAGPDGQPAANAEVALVVVDEAVLALTGYELTDPLEVFYGPLFPTLSSRYTRSSVLLTRDDLLAGGDDDSATTPAAEVAEGAVEDSAGGDGAGAPSARAAGAPDAPPITLRDDFDPVAVFASGQRTGPDGTVTVAVPLPDTLTRYRVMAVAVDGAERFGKGESTITARLPLMIRPSAPRFLNYGDAFEMPVVVQNQTDAPMDVSLAVQGANLVIDGATPIDATPIDATPIDATTSATGTLVTVPANTRIEVRFPMRADAAGTARMRIAGVSGDASDAAEIEFPVYTPATAEAFATYGVIDEPGQAVGQPITPPAGVIPEFGGLEINTSTTALQALTDAVIHLDDYRYATPEGYASRILAISSLRDVLDAFDAEGLPSRDQLDARVAADIAALVALQNDDGGWSWWARGLESVPWQSLQSSHALVAANARGTRCPPMRSSERSHTCARSTPTSRPTTATTCARRCGRTRSTSGRSPATATRLQATAIYRRGGIALQLDADRVAVAVDRRPRDPGRDRTAATQCGDRDRRRGHVRHVVLRGRVRDRRVRPPNRRRDPRRADLPGPAKRSDPEGGRRPARAADARPLEQRPGQRVHPRRDAALLRAVRERHARARRARLAGHRRTSRSRNTADAPPTVPRPWCR
jgi:alpha-2-macroglobulin